MTRPDHDVGGPQKSDEGISGTNHSVTVTGSDIIGFHERLRYCDCTHMEVMLFHMLGRHQGNQDLL